MKTGYVAIAVLAGTLVQPSVAQPTQPSLATLAEALDICLASYAVQLTYSSASDDAIYAAAKDGCKKIETELIATVRRDVPPAQADAALRQWAAVAKPNFMTVIQRIRADRSVPVGK